MRRDRISHGSSIVALIAMGATAFCPVCVFSMFFGTISLGIGLATSSYLPVFIGFLVVFSIPFSWRGYQWFKKGRFAKFKVRSFTFLQLTIGTALFLVGLLSQNPVIMGSGYITCLLIPILYKMRLKGHRSIAVLLLFALVSFALFSRIVSYSLFPQNGCVLCATSKTSNLNLSGTESSDKNGFKDSLISSVDGVVGSGKPAFLFFYADWCHFCQKMEPVIEGLKARYAGKVVFILLNEKDNANALQEFRVDAFPTMFLIVEKKGGEYSGSVMSGYTEEQALVSALDNALAKTGKTVAIPVFNTSLPQVSAVSSGVEQPLINALVLGVLFLVPAFFWKKRETLKTNLNLKPCVGITLLIIIVCGTFSSLPHSVGGLLHGVASQTVVEEDLGFDLAMIRALEQTGFGDALDSVIDKVLSSGRFVFLFFYADWCHFCQQEKPIIAELEPLYSDEIIFIHLNNAKNPEAMEEFGVEGFPTMFLIYGKDGGQYVYRTFNGFTEKALLESDFASLAKGDINSLQNDHFVLNNDANGEYVHHSCSISKCINRCINQNMHFTAGNLFSQLMSGLIKCAGFGKAKYAFEAAYQGAETTQCAAECHESMEAAKEGKITDARAEANCFKCAASNALQAIPVIGEELACPLTALEKLYDILATPADCLAECAAPSSTWSQDYGHECRDHRSPDKYVCVSPSAKGKLVCSDCEYLVDLKSTLPCPVGTECQETPVGPTCIRKCEPSECDDGDPCTVDKCMSVYWGGQGCVHWRTPGCDKPDDSYDVSSISLAESTATYKKPDVGVLSSGFTPILFNMLRNSGVEGASIDASLQGIESYPAFIIPSGALSGLDSSATFKSSLEQYVYNGGTLIVFSQQHGYEYKALPGGNLTGYGWLEDQSCQLASVEVSTYNPIFSGRNSTVLDVNVDGFFTSYPRDSTILLSRTKNGMPAMLMYSYGYGRVLATTLYSDMAPGLYQGTADEKILVRDLVNWAKSEETATSFAPGSFTVSINVTNPYPSSVKYPVQEFNAGDTVNLQINVRNPGNVTVDKVSFLLFDPSANKFWANVTDAIQAGQSKIVDVKYQTTSLSKSGLWTILYVLSAGDSNYIGYGGEFALSYHINDLSQLTAFLTVRDPQNNIALTQSDVSLFVLPGRTGSINFTLNTKQLGVWTVEYSILNKGGGVLISEKRNFAVSDFKENPEGLAYQSSELAFAVTSDQETYLRGASVVFSIHIWNRGDVERNITVSGTENVWWWANKLSFNHAIIVPSKGYVTFNYTALNIMRSDRLRVTFFEDDVPVGFVFRGFWVVTPSIRIRTETDRQKYLRGERVALNCTMNGNVPSFTLASMVLNPKGLKIFEEYISITLPPGAPENRTLVFSLPSDAELGTYQVISTAYDQSNVKVGFNISYFEVPILLLRLDFDKPFYRVRDRLEMNLTIGNSRPVGWNQTINISIPDLSLQDSSYIEIPPLKRETLLYNLTIPETTRAGKYPVVVRCVEDNVTEESVLFIPGSKLEHYIEKTSYSANENIGIILLNVGGVDANYTRHEVLLDPYLNQSFENSKAGIIKAGETLLFAYNTGGLVEGNYYLWLSTENRDTNETSSAFEILAIDGLEAELTSETDSRIYLVDDIITILTNITNISSEEIRGAFLNLKIQSSMPLPPKQCVIPKDDLYIHEDTVLCPGTYSITDVNKNGIIIINSSGVTVEGNNTIIIATGSSLDNGYGIINPGFNDVTIRNVEIRNYLRAIVLQNSETNLIENNTIYTSIQGDGVALSGSRYNIIRGNSITTGAYGRYGITLDGSEDNTISNNTAAGNINYGIGVYLRYSKRNTLSENIVHENSGGIILEWSDNNTITGNDAYNNLGDVKLLNSNGNIIKGNSITNTAIARGWGVQVRSSSNNTISNNIVKSKVVGISVEYGTNNLTNNTMGANTYNLEIIGDKIEDFIQKIDTSNTVDGKPVYYLVGVTNYTLDASTNAGFVAFVNSANVTVRDLALSNNGQGIILANTSKSLVENVTVFSNYWEGMALHFSNENTITKCNVSSNYSNGISFYSSNSNIVRDSNINSNNRGINIWKSNYTSITHNIISDDYYGIHISSSSNQDITNNTFNDDEAGIYIEKSASIMLLENSFNNNSEGISTRSTTNSIIKNNNVTSGRADGIFIEASTNNTITGNNASNNSRHGIWLLFSSNNILENNNASGNLNYGIYLQVSDNNTLKNNLMSSNTYNFAVKDSLGNGLYNDIATDNLVDGKPIYYMINASNVIIDPSSNAGTVYCINCNNITAIGLNLTHNQAGIYFYNTSNSLVQDNTISENYYGVHSYNTSYSFVQHNSISKNYYGIYLKVSHNNAISDNTLSENGLTEYNAGAIQLEGSTANKILNNTAGSNYIGIYLNSYSNYNIVSSNDASNNRYGVTIYNSLNNILSENKFCSNADWDITDSTSTNSGYNNTCSRSYGWNDVGATGCTYKCAGGGSAFSCLTVSLPTPLQTAPMDNLTPSQVDTTKVLHYYDETSLLTGMMPLPSSRVQETLNNTPMFLTGLSTSESNIIWERNIAINITDFTNLATVVGKLAVTGKLYLYATLISSSGQIIDYSVYPFYITDGDLALTIEANKQIYKPGENVTITGTIENKGLARDVTLTLKANDTDIYTQNVHVEQNSSYHFNTSILAASSFTLRGLVDGINITDHIRVESPLINITLDAPDIVGVQAFKTVATISNLGNTSVSLNVTLGVKNWNLTLDEHSAARLEVEMTLSEDKTLILTISGDANLTLNKNIIFGEKTEIDIYPDDVNLEGSVEIPYTINNTGILDTIFNATFTIDSQTITRQIFVSAGQNLTDFLRFNLTKGMYILKCESPFWTNSININVESDAQLIITSMPQNLNFNLGEESNLTITVKNIGGKAGKAQLHLQSPGLIDEYNEAWVESGQEINMTLSLTLPDDVEEKSYKLNFDLNGEQYETTFFMEGAKISVIGTLDQPFYREGENATFTVKVENLRDMNLTLFTRVRLDEYDVTVYYNLTSFQNKTLSFLVPLIFNSEKLLYAVYLASGRSLYINSAYIYPEPPNSAGLTLQTDKQVYEAGETAKIFVNATKTGRLIVKAPIVNINTTLEIGSTLFTFEVPLLRSGTYLLEYSFDNFTTSYPIDIIGYSVRIIESSIDKEIYQAVDNVNVSLMIDVNKGFEGQLQAFILNPQGQVIGTIASNYTFTIGENKMSLTAPLITNQTGLHSIVFRVYAYGSFIFLASAARYFDAYIPPDTTPPVIGPVDTTNQLDANRPVTQNEPIAVNAIVTDNVNVAQVTLYYRRPGENYVELVMPKCPGCIDTYNNTIPASFVTTATIEYYINATDGINIATYPAANPATNPIIIQVNLYPVAVVLSQPSEITESSMKLSWTQSSDLDFKNCTIYRSNVQGSLGTLTHTITDKLTTSYVVTELSANTTYYFTIRIYDTGGLYADSNQVAAKTNAATPPTQNVAPIAVTLNPATDVTENSLKLSWTKNTDVDFKNYVAHRSTTSGAIGTAVVTITDSSLTSCDVTGLTANTTYYLTIRVYDTGGLSADSNQIVATTLAPASEPPSFPLVPVAGGLTIAAIAIIIIMLFVMKRRKKNYEV